VPCIDAWLAKGTCCPLCKRDVVMMVRAVGLLPPPGQHAAPASLARRMAGMLSRLAGAGGGGADPAAALAAAEAEEARRQGREAAGPSGGRRSGG
jgi:hypothetical protein